MLENTVVGAILAGGEGRRMGGAKALTILAGMPLVAHVARCLRPNVETLVVIGDAAGARCINAAIAFDSRDLPKGPLTGVLAALEWAADRRREWVVTVPCDTPLLPDNLVDLLCQGARTKGASAACAETADGAEPLIALWRVDLASALRATLEDGVHPPVHRFLDEIGAACVVFDSPDAFMNVNSPEDLALAAEVLRLRG